MRDKKKGKIAAALLSGVLLGVQPEGIIVQGAAGYTGGICEHHPVHTAECGYQEAAAEQPCRHEHTKECYEYVTGCVHVHTGECYPLIAVEVPAGDQDTEGTAEDAGTAAEPQTELVRGSDPTACTHVCSEDSGCVTKTLNCIHEDKRNADGSITHAVHDAGCGYAPAVEGKECTFVCEICSAQSLSETETEAVTVQTGIAAAGSADSEPSAKSTEAGDEGTDEEETDPETEESTGKTPEAGTEGTESEETDPETEESTEKTPDSDAETETDEAVPDEAVTEVQAMIEALPSVEEVEKMTPEEQKEIYNDAQDAADAYFDLSEEQQKQVDLKKLMDLMNFFNGQVSTMATGYTLADGVLTITSREGLISFANNTNIKSIIIKSGVEGSIGGYAFSNCSNLTSVTIEAGANITSIGQWAFYGCSSLTSITIPKSVTSIGGYAFRDCSSLTSVTIEAGANITSIGQWAFYNCGLTSITIPEGVTSIGDSAFRGCSNLTEVTLPATAPTTVKANSFDGWNKKKFIIPETSIGTGNGQYNLNASPWNSIVLLNGSSLIRSVDVTLTEPVGGSVLSTEASCTTTGVRSSSVSWTLNGTPVEDGAKAGYGKSYTAGITLTALTSTDTSATSQSYRFVDGISATLNGAAVTATVSDSGKTLRISKTCQITKQSQNSPDISINYQDETLNTTEDMQYRTNEEEEWTTCSAAMDVADFGWDGTAAKTVQIRMKETADAYASDPVSVEIPARPAITVGSTTASSLTVSASVSDIPAGVLPEVQYQLVADGGSIDSEKWQNSGEFRNLKADTSYTAYAKCDATDSSFASDTSQQVRTSAAAYTVTIPSEVIAGDSTGKGEAEISIDISKNFDLGHNGQVQVKVKSGVSSDGSLTLTRQGAFDTLTSAMFVNGTKFTNIGDPVATFKMDNYQTAKAKVSFAQPTGTQAVIPAGTYSGTVFFEVTYSEQGGGTE